VSHEFTGLHTKFGFDWNCAGVRVGGRAIDNAASAADTERGEAGHTGTNLNRV
jgi:hypothetical protein